MYEDFYELKEKPFDLTPSPRFLYLGENHKEAMALLTYGVAERKGFVLLTGEVGSGKTTMVQALLSTLDERVQCAYLSNPVLSPEDFIRYLTSSTLGSRFRSKGEFIIQFEAFLKECLQHQKNFVLIVDEAQKLSFDLLEEIRLLSNMESADEKLINIILVGQPELNEKLREPRCRPLLQRISIRYHIQPLSLEETRAYMGTRLQVAGIRSAGDLFMKDAITAIHEFSRGYPRMINILADNALLLGYATGKKRITASMIKECHEDLQAGGLPGEDDRQRSVSPATGEENSFPAPRILRWRRVALLLVVMVGLSIFAYQPGKDLLSRLAAHLSMISGRALERGEAEPGPVKEAIEKPREEAPQNEAPEVKGPIPEKGLENEASKEIAASLKASPQGQGPFKEDVAETWKTATVREGDTLAGMAVGIYGRADSKILDLVKRNNPRIVDINLIEAGQKIVFPPISVHERAVTYTVHIASFKVFKDAQSLFQKLMSQGEEVYIVPIRDAQKGKVFRVTLGSFGEVEEARDYADVILGRGLSDYASPVRLEMR